MCYSLLFQIALLSKNDKEKLWKEVSIMISFRHPNVMSLIGLCLDGETPLLIMPFMAKGSVLEYVRHNREILYIIGTANIEEVINYDYIIILLTNLYALTGKSC